MIELLIATGWTLAAGFIGYAIASARYRGRVREIETNLYYLQRYLDESRKRMERKRAEIRERHRNA